MKRNRRFIFKQDFNGIAKGTQLDLVEGRFYMQNGVNGGIVPPYMYEGLARLVEQEDYSDNPKILREVAVPFNKA